MFYVTLCGGLIMHKKPVVYSSWFLSYHSFVQDQKNILKNQVKHVGFI